ncbi:MAG: hypothetical protein ACYDA7_05285 [Acidithiobacillus sp.]
MLGWFTLLVTVILGVASLYVIVFTEDAKRLFRVLGVRGRPGGQSLSAGVLTADGPCNRFLVHQTVYMSDLVAIWEIDCAAYGAMNVDFDILKKWWAVYPQGHYVIKNGDQVIGGFGIWPVTKKDYQALRSGRIAESAITPCAHKPRSISHYWYLSGIVVDAKHRGSRAVWCLVRQAVAHWFSTQAEPSGAIGVTVGSIPVSRDGLKLLTRFGFSLQCTAEQRMNHHPFYARIVDNTAIAAFLDEFSRHV